MVRGPAVAVDTLESLGVFVDLAGLAPGRYQLPLHIDPATNVEVQRVEPSTVEVRLR